MGIFKTIGKQTAVTPETLGIAGVGTLATRNASGQFVGQGPGADGQVLTANSGEVTGLLWQTISGGGTTIYEIPLAIVGFNQTLPSPAAADVYVQEVMLTANAVISLAAPSGSPDYARFILSITPNTDGVTPTLGQAGATIKAPNGDQPLISEVNGDTTLWLFEWHGSAWHLVNVIVNEESV